MQINLFCYTKSLLNIKTMERYCLRLETEVPITKITKQSSLVLMSNCAVWGRMKSRFIKNQEVSALVSKLVIRTLLSKIRLAGDILVEK